MDQLQQWHTLIEIDDETQDSEMTKKLLSKMENLARLLITYISNLFTMFGCKSLQKSLKCFHLFS